MNPIFAAAREIQDFCRGRGWRSCVIGGLAVQRWGEPRLTRDVDVTLLTGFGSEASSSSRTTARPRDGSAGFSSRPPPEKTVSPREEIQTGSPCRPQPQGGRSSPSTTGTGAGTAFQISRA